MTIRTMDDATKKALAGLLPFAPGAYFEDTLDCFRGLPEEAQPRFRSRDFTAAQFYAMRAALRNGGAVDHATKVKTLQEGALIRWDNLPDSAFNEIAYSADAIAALPVLWVEELYWRSERLCNPNKLEREGLGSSPAPASDTSSSPALNADAAQA